MRKPIFFDSWGWIAVVDRKDPYHETAKAFYQEYVKGGGIPITTDYILDEVFTVLRRRLTHQVVVKFGEGIFEAVRVQKLRFELPLYHLPELQGRQRAPVQQGKNADIKGL